MSIRGAFRRGAERVGVRPDIKPVATRVCTRQPGDFVIARIKDGHARTIDEATEVARKREPAAVHVGTDARFYVFGKR